MFIKTFTPVLLLTALVLGGCTPNANTDSANPEGATVPTEPTEAASPEDAGNVLVGLDGQSQLTLLNGWVEDRELHESAEIQASKRGSEEYVIVLSENKADFENLTIEQHSEITRGLLVESLTDPEITGPTDVTTVGSNPAVQYEIQGTIEGINVAYLHTTVETPTKYHQILAWTLPSSFERNKPELQQVIQGFKEVEAPAATESPAPSPAQ
ncbi:hypothetical protein H6F93_29260 [Leptolyngbya sp. FACHB-671]|uniref:hypothetical protein n=1 Tax=Leptolyngbya sp. FACHB-671 TaxID=2692812 RepID=UPI0016821AB6|nr:hypothetical protein [Leptolyngbya sp. FACHB-671]MBD2071559.1 hypothetical protein [Leptolyngbya sp. FACHB-671]